MFKTQKKKKKINYFSHMNCVIYCMAMYKLLVVYNEKNTEPKEKHFLLKNQGLLNFQQSLGIWRPSITRCSTILFSN